MLKKNKDKMERKSRPTWGAYYTRKTPTKKEKITKQLKRDIQNGKYE